MSLQRLLLNTVVALLFAFSSLHAGAATIPPLERLPLGERWFGIFFNDERVGYSLVRMSEESSGYRLYGESNVKMSGFAFSRDASVRETYLTGRDLALRSFSVLQTIDGAAMNVKGDVSPAGLRVTIQTGGAKKEKLLKHKGPLYPPMALNLLPLLQGTAPGKKLGIAMLDPEEVKIRKVSITVVGPDKTDTGKTLHLRNNLFPVANDIWVDYEGHTIEESLRDGWIVTRAEDEKTIRSFITEAALTRKEFIYDFGLVRLESPLARPAELKKLAIEISGFPAAVPLLSNAVQNAEQTAEGKVLITVDNTPATAAPEPSGPSPAELHTYLQQTEHLPSENPLLIAKKNEIAGAEISRGIIAAKLARWVASQVKDIPAGSPSTLEALKKGEGNSLDRMRLFTSLARSAAIPARPVAGLVYVRDKGFLYHCWVEIYLGHWLPVDPSRGEFPADATHVKLVEGDTAEDLLDLSRFVGNIGVKVTESAY